MLGFVQFLPACDPRAGLEGPAQPRLPQAGRDAQCRRGKNAKCQPLNWIVGTPARRGRGRAKVQSPGSGATSEATCYLLPRVQGGGGSLEHPRLW